MKVWLLLSRFEMGGLERVQANLAPSLKAAGLDVWIVAGRFFEGAETMLPHNIPRLEIAARGPYAFACGLVKQLHAHRPDIVMTTSNDVACLILIVRAMFFPEMKVICTQHLSLSAPWRIAKGFRRIKLSMLMWLMQNLLPKADGIIAVSGALATDMRHVLKLKRAIHVIYNPIVLPDSCENMEEPIEWPWSDRSLPTLIFAGRLAKVKRLDLLMEAFLQVGQMMDARLLILGAGPERNFILEFIARHKLQRSCRVMGHQSNPLPWIKASDILVLPSDYEGFGNVLVEAMACGTQVISSDCPDGPAEILQNGEYGQLVPPGNSDALAQAMHRAVSKEFVVPAPTLMRRASEFSLDRASTAYLAVIHSIAHNKA